jgi:hypothetical protein
MHMMMGMGNNPFKHFLQYIDEWHEWIGEEELEAWEAGTPELDIEGSLYISRKEDSEYQLFLMQMELTTVKAQKKERQQVGTNKSKHSLADQQEMNKCMVNFKNDIAGLKAEAEPENKMRLKYLATRKRKLKKEG